MNCAFFVALNLLAVWAPSVSATQDDELVLLQNHAKLLSESQANKSSPIAWMSSFFAWGSSKSANDSQPDGAAEEDTLVAVNASSDSAGDSLPDGDAVDSSQPMDFTSESDGSSNQLNATGNDLASDVASESAADSISDAGAINITSAEDATAESAPATDAMDTQGTSAEIDDTLSDDIAPVSAVDAQPEADVLNISAAAAPESPGEESTNSSTKVETPHADSNDVAVDRYASSDVSGLDDTDAFVTGTNGSNACPSGYKGIGDVFTCKKAMRTLTGGESQFVRKDSWTDFPAGCHQRPDGTVFLNNNTGDSRNGVAPLCEKEDFGVAGIFETLSADGVWWDVTLVSRSDDGKYNVTLSDGSGFAGISEYGVRGKDPNTALEWKPEPADEVQEVSTGERDKENQKDDADNHLVKAQASSTAVNVKKAKQVHTVGGDRMLGRYARNAKGALGKANHYEKKAVSVKDKKAAKLKKQLEHDTQDLTAKRDVLDMAVQRGGSTVPIDVLRQARSDYATAVRRMSKAQETMR